MQTWRLHAGFSRRMMKTARSLHGAATAKTKMDRLLGRYFARSVCAITWTTSRRPKSEISFFFDLGWFCLVSKQRGPCVRSRGYHWVYSRDLTTIASYLLRTHDTFSIAVSPDIRFAKNKRRNHEFVFKWLPNCSHAPLAWFPNKGLIYVTPISDWLYRHFEM